MIDANDAPAVLDLNPPREVEENAPKNDYIGRVFAYDDADSNQEAKFSITQGNGDGIFAIGSCSGQLYLVKPVLDYNVQVRVAMGRARRRGCSGTGCSSSM